MPRKEGAFLVMDFAGFRNDYFFSPFKKMNVLPVDVKTEVSEADGAWQVTLSADRPAFFVTVSADGFGGEFSDNSFTLLPGEPVTLAYAKRPDEANRFSGFRRSLKVEVLK